MAERITVSDNVQLGIKPEKNGLKLQKLKPDKTRKKLDTNVLYMCTSPKMNITNMPKVHLVLQAPTLAEG